MGQRKKKLGTEFYFYGFKRDVSWIKKERCTKTSKKHWRVPNEIFENNTSMLVLEGDDVQVHPSKNYIFYNPFNISFDKEGSDMIHRNWQDLSKTEGSVDIRTFIASFKSENH